ncbi:MAG: TonB-dependent receptor domain-containing protein [Bryobacteraceae bacterium]
MKLFALSGAFFALSISSFAQTNGRLSGSVLDSSGSAIPGASIGLSLPGGSSPVFTSETTAEGLYSMTGLRPDTYDLSFEAAGFQKTTLRGIKIDPGRETSLPPVKLEVGAVNQVVEVTAESASIQTSNAEISTTVTNEQVRRLPLLNRNASALINTQAGVASGRGPTVINGVRASTTNMTIDGINIQDNYIRSNALDFQPNRLFLDQVAEFTVSTSNTNAAAGAGAAQITVITPSGSNEFHGSVYWSNRNNAFAATSWFNNQAGLTNPFLNQNQLGGKFGGPIWKNKLFAYANYEAFRLRQQSSINRTILTGDARNGIFTYQAQGSVRKVNVLEAAGVSADPTMQQILGLVPGADKVNNFRIGDSREGLLRNTAGYSFFARNNTTRDNVTGKFDYILSPKHFFSASYLWNSEQIDRNDVAVANDFSTVPKVVNEVNGKLLSATWRWSPAPRFTSELRGGFNLAPGLFVSSQQYGKFVAGNTLFSNPTNEFRDQGRFTDTYHLASNSSWLRSRHNLQFGFQTEQIRINRYNDAGITPTYNLGISSNNTFGLTGAQLPGVSANDVATANALLANLAGFVDNYTQTFNVTSRDSGFVDGAALRRHYTLNNYAFYLQDNWKINRRLTLNLGLRYEQYSPVDETDSIALLPRLINGDPVATLLGNPTLDFAGASAGRPWYNRDKNNFAPNAGFAWDVKGDGRMAIRGGYTISFVNDEMVRAVVGVVDNNDGLRSVSTQTGLTGRVGSNPPPVRVPTFQVPRTFADNYGTNSQVAFGMPDPGLVTPYVQQWNLSVQRQIKGTTVEVRYVGNHSVKLYRGFDYNQVNIKAGGFVDDFQRARRNGFAARDANGVFNPAYNAAIPGSQPLTVFPLLAAGGNLANANNRLLIERGEVAQLAATYQVNRQNGPINFFPNALALTAQMLTNYSHSSYNGLQVDVRRSTRRGLHLQANYTYSKVLSDSLGDGSLRAETFLDINNPQIERARAPFDLTHNIKANGIYELPFGPGHRWNYRPVSRLLEGWSVSSLMLWNSGTPFSVLSTRGTLNRTTLSQFVNTANTPLNKSQLDGVVGFYMTGAGPMFINPAVLAPDGRAVGADGAAPYQGQVFFNAEAGGLGALQRRMFSGPWTFNLGLGILKRTRLFEKHAIELRAETNNVLNHPTFYVGDESVTNTRFNINQPTFGRITGAFYDRRLLQFGMQYRF